MISMCKNTSADTSESCAFTICSWNYLAYSLTLAESFTKYHPNISFYIFLADRDKAVEFTLPPNVSILLLSEEIVPDLYRMASWYTILEFNTSVKAHCFDYLFDVKRHLNSVYFDPDILILDNLDELFSRDLFAYDCVITPHITEPIMDEFYPDDLAFARSGIYNLGFIGFNNSAPSRNFIRWWRSRLEKECYVALDKGIFVDQKFCDFIPAFVSSVKIQRDPGYNLAYWNLAQRKLSIADGKLLASNSIVKFIHFSGVDPHRPDLFSKHQNRFTLPSIGLMTDIYNDYIARLIARDHYSLIKYGFNKLSDGTTITSAMRECFRLYWSDIDKPELAFNVDKDFFTKPSKLTSEYACDQVNRLVAEIYRSRKDLSDAFDITQKIGRQNLNHWASVSLQREYGINLDYAKCEDATINNEFVETTKPARLYYSIDLFNKLSKLLIFYCKSLISSQGKVSYDSDEIAWNVAYTYELLPIKLRNKLIDYLRFDLNPQRRKLFSHWLDERGLRDILPEYNTASKFTRSEYLIDNNSESHMTKTLNNLHGYDIYGFFNTETGVGQAARELSRAIGAANIAHSNNVLLPAGYENNIQFSSRDEIISSHLNSLLVLNADNVLNLEHYFDPKIIENTHKIGFFFWELPVFPGVWTQACDFLDEIWVPSSFVADSLKTATKRPVKVIPLPVQINKRDKIACRMSLGLSIDKMIFLTIFDYNSFPERKNPLATLRAFLDAFPPNDVHGPMLIIKCHGVLNRGDYGKELNRLASLSQNIMIIDEVMNREQLLMLQAACDVFVSLHRSEGFGLNLAECMAAEKLTIATNFSGNIDFMDQDNSILVEYKLQQLRYGDYVHWEGQVWADPIHDSAVEAFRIAASSDSKRLMLGARAKNTIQDILSYDAIGKTIISVFND